MGGVLDLCKHAMNMMAPKLQDDLLNDFSEQKKTLTEQIELFDPLATSLRRPAAQRLMSKGGLILAEIFAYLFCLGTIAFSIFMNWLYPFAPLQNVRYIKGMDDIRQLTEPEHFSIAVHGLAAFIALLFFIIARVVRSVRLKNDILDLAGKNIKTLFEIKCHIRYPPYYVCKVIINVKMIEVHFLNMCPTSIVYISAMIYYIATVWRYGRNGAGTWHRGGTCPVEHSIKVIERDDRLGAQLHIHR